MVINCLTEREGKGSKKQNDREHVGAVIVSYLWTSMVSSRRKDTQAHRKNTWLQKIMMPMKKPAPRMRVSAGWAYSACMPNGAWGTAETLLWRHMHVCVVPLHTCVGATVFNSLISNSSVKRLTRKWCVYLSYHLCVCFTHGELMVDFVDVFVDPAVMQQAVEEVVPGIFNNSTAKALSHDVRPGGGSRERWVIIRKPADLTDGSHWRPRTNKSHF